MQKQSRAVLQVVIGVLVVTVAFPRDVESRTPPARAEADPCQSITPGSMTSWARTIEQALRSAEKDARANGENGAYAVAATNARNLLDRAQKRAADGAAQLQAADPRVTTYAEGGMIKENVRISLDWMTQAGHWALVSAIYHKSTDARAAFEGTITALAEGQRLFAESGRCYVNGYL